MGVAREVEVAEEDQSDEEAEENPASNAAAETMLIATRM